jgi:hypothetical protein
MQLYKPVILPVVFYGRDTWPFTFREEYELRIFEEDILA